MRGSIIATGLIAAAMLGAAPPRLVITEIQYNPTSSEHDDRQTEWVEVMNIGGASINLKGLQLTSGTRARPRDARQRFILGDVTVPPGGRAVIGIGSPESYADLGLPKMAAHCGELKFAWLTNTDGDGVAIRDERGGVIDEVVYATASPWPAVNPGCTLQFVAPAGADPAAANDDPRHWVASDESNAHRFPEHGMGTPGAPPKPATRPTR
jgi:hypothetical protein